MKKILIGVLIILVPSFALASTKHIYLTSSSGSWTVPSDWLPTNSVEVIGGGGGGGGGEGIDYVEWWAFGPGGGGGGGGYAKISNLAAQPGDKFYYSVGTGGAGGAWSGNGGLGGDTFFCSNQGGCDSIAGKSVLVGAKGGLGGTIAPGNGGAGGGTGGQADAGAGAVKYSGGDGGTDVANVASWNFWSGAPGGGGSGGPGGAGGKGGNGYYSAGGGGGGGGVSASDFPNAPSPGGANRLGAGAGTPGIASSPTGGTGADGGGGGGGYDAVSTSGSGAGGTGGTGSEWDATHGSGGGGGGGGSWNEMPGGAGGLYGGGGGGGGVYNGSAWDGGTNGGAGAPGIIVISYTNLAPSAPSITGATSASTGVQYTYTFQSADPEGDTLRYGIDWNNDGAVDEWAPALGYVPSGTVTSTTHTWNTAGTQTFRVLAQDVNGNNSGWTSYSVSVSNVPFVLLTASPSSIGSGQSSTLTWSSSNADSCVATNFTMTPGGQSFSYTGSDQTFTVPAGVTSVTAKMWGAGGQSDGEPGAAGGYTSGTIAVTPGQQLTVMVGGAGQNSTTGAYGGGGAGVPYNGYWGGGGGGRSAVRSGGSELITAGGGGGGGGCGGVCPAASAGGGTSGQAAGDSASGQPGTQTAGGAGGACNSGVGGTQFTGGTGGGFADGGGGGGWYGGGSGCFKRSGGGGSGYCGGTGVSSCSTTAGSGTTPANGSDSDLPGGDAVVGGPGFVKISWTAVTTSGSVNVFPLATTQYTVTCTGPGGQASDSKTVTYACTPSYYCAGNNVKDSCTNSVVQQCPYQCAAGACIGSPPPSFASGTSDSGISLTGHLQVAPSLLSSGLVTHIYWNISNVSNCSISGSNGDSWSHGSAGCGGSSCTSGSSGKTSSKITQQTVYTLSCTGLDGSAINESATVNILPVFKEL